MAALTTQSQATVASTAATSSSVAAAITQLDNNQQVMMQHMMAYTNVNTTHNPPAVHHPPPQAFHQSNHWKLPTRWEHTQQQKAGVWAWSTRPCNCPRWTLYTTHPICRLHSTSRWDEWEHCASLCTGSTGRHRGCTKHSPYVFQHRQEIQQNECVFLVWIRCGRWPHVQDMSPSVETFQSSRSI